VSRDRIESDAGPEIRCAKCREFWPADPEFYFIQTDGRPHSWCKACYIEERVAKGQRPGYGKGAARNQAHAL
jgi:hypothetical protein